MLGGGGKNVRDLIKDVLLSKERLKRNTNINLVTNIPKKRNIYVL